MVGRLLQASLLLLLSCHVAEGLRLVSTGVPSARRLARSRIQPGLGPSAVPSGQRLGGSTTGILPDASSSVPIEGVGAEKRPLSSLLANSEPFPRCSKTDSVEVAVQRMSDANRGGCVVVDEQGKLDGMFTERDFVVKIVDGKLNATETLIQDVMTPASLILSVRPEMTIGDCRRLIIKENRRRVPVLDANGMVLGLISSRDLVRTLQSSILARESALLYGTSFQDISAQARERANTLALESGESGSKQDLLRALFVCGFAALGAGFLLEGTWIREHETLAMVATFALGYVGIVFETFLEFNKAAISLLMAVALWIIFAGAGGGNGVEVQTAVTDLSEKISEVSEVIFFLLGAMTIVEVVDAHAGFKVVTDNIRAKDKRGLMWVIGFITFFMSSILDNLTTTIVMVSLIKKLLTNAEDRKLFGAMIVIAANAGGAWTPIGDVTTTMLWINGQISAVPTMVNLVLPSIVSVLLSIFMLQQQIPEGELVEDASDLQTTEIAPRGKIVFSVGLLGLLSVPVFKTLTGLPPYLGMLAALGVMWTLTDAIHAGEGKQGNEELMTPAALRKIDTSGILFFLGILLSIGALDSAGILRSLAQFLDQNIPSQEIIAAVIGIASALIDNVPLVAATMGMYPLSTLPMDSELWQLIAYCAGTGGSMLVIGSAAGVALMGIEKVDFVWYARKITAAAALGYFGGIGAFLLQRVVLEGGLPF